MSLVFIVWLVTTFIPSVGVVLAIVLFAGTFLLIFLIAFALIENKLEPLKKFVSYKKSIFLVVFLACAIPSKEATWYMIGAYGTQKLIENPEAQALASDGVDVLKQLLAKAKRELSEETPKK